MKNLADLNLRKEMLKKDISELEDKFRFKNPKESLSAFTNGFTDQFLSDKVDFEGHHRMGLKPAKIISFLSGGASDNFIKTTHNESGEEKIEIKTQNLFGSLAENAMKLGIATMVASYAKKSLRHKKWKRKILGFVLIYMAPALLRMLREKLEEFEEKEVIKSLNKII